MGEYDDLTKKGFPKTGTENYGGPIVTDGGLFLLVQQMMNILELLIKTGDEIGEKTSRRICNTDNL